MKIVAVADALLPEVYVREGLTEFEKRGVEIETLSWGENDQEAIDKRAINLEMNGPTAETPPEEIYPHIADTDILMVHYCPVSDDLLQKAGDLKIVATFRAGIENVDVEAATKRGILVFHVVGRTTEAVSDFTVGLLLAEARNIARAHMAIVNGIWRKEYSNSATTPELESKTAGIVGFGKIGRAVLRKLRGFNMKFLVYDPYVSASDIAAAGGEVADLDTLLKNSDFVSLHVRMIKGEKPLIGEAQLKMMKPTAYLINTARAYVVDQDALYRALKDKMISGAAIDTFSPEPLPPGHPFLELDNITLTPHLASSTLECVANSPRLLTEEIIKFLETGSSRFILNREVIDQHSAEHFNVWSETMC